MTTPLGGMCPATIIGRVHSPGGRVSRSGAVFAWVGALLFGASLAYFLFTYTVTFGENQQSTPTAAAVAWDVGLFSVFALHHSVFARERVRSLVARSVPAALERSVYVWIASLLFIAVCALWRPVGGVAWSVSPPLGWMLYAVMGAGLWLSARSAAVIDVLDLAGLRQIAQPDGHLPTSRNPGHSEFVAAGPYGVVRHPIYLGWVLMVFGVPVMTGTRLVFALVSCAYLVVAIPLEERTPRRTTSGRYDDYVRLVRWKLFPGLY